MNYNDMIRTVAGATGLTRSQADAAAVTVLTVMAEALPASETKDLLAQLPKSIRERVPVNSEPLTMRPIEFIARVADLGGLSIDDAERNIRATFSVLTQAVNAGEMNDIAEVLGDEFADLLGRADRVARERAAQSAPRSLPDVVVQTAESLVQTAADLVQRPIKAGMRATGLKR
jgi:uncharacterized protein (DUF2267 family)